jgi:hypothetical protein
LRDIDEGDELLLEYGDNYWETVERHSKDPYHRAPRVNSSRVEAPTAVYTLSDISVGAIVELDMDSLNENG